MRDAFIIAAGLHIAQLQRPQTEPEYDEAERRILNSWEEGNFEECARIFDRFPILRVEGLWMGSFLADAMKSFDATEIMHLIDVRLFVALPTTDARRNNVWTYAVEENRLDVMRELRSRRETHAIDTNTLTQALSYAARESYRSEMIAWLIEAGAYINSVAAEDRFKYVHPLTFALHDALNVGTEETVRALLNLGADPNHRDSEGGVPLVWAASYGDISKVRALLSHGAYAPSETEDADFWEALELAPEDCVEEIRRSSRSRELGEMLGAVLRHEPPSSGGTSVGALVRSSRPRVWCLTEDGEPGQRRHFPLDARKRKLLIKKGVFGFAKKLIIPWSQVQVLHGLPRRTKSGACCHCCALACLGFAGACCHACQFGVRSATHGAPDSIPLRFRHHGRRESLRVNPAATSRASGRARGEPLFHLK